MSAVKNRTSRRAFVLSGGATLGSGVAMAAAAGATALPSGEPSLAEQLARRDDLDAIRKLHTGFIADVESTARAGALSTHRAYRPNARQAQDALTLDANRLQASASWNVDVQVVTPIVGDSTLEQMARLQGLFGDLRWEAGRLEARYEKTHGKWQMINLAYVAS